jgi:hypothetical protein
LARSTILQGVDFVELGAGKNGDRLRCIPALASYGSLRDRLPPEGEDEVGAFHLPPDKGEDDRVAVRRGPAALARETPPLRASVSIAVQAEP